MNKMQLKDLQKCEEMEERGKSKDCFECSCNVCIAQEPSMFSNKELLLIKRAIERYRGDAYAWLLRTDENALSNHAGARLDAEESSTLLNKLEGLLQ